MGEPGMNAVRIGVIGAGNMGADHVNTLHRHVSGALVTVVADIDEERATDVAGALPDARATGDPYAVIADPEVDAVVVASHDSTHAELFVAAVRAGKPALCEKPLAPTRPNASAWCARSGGPAGGWSRWASCAASTPRTWN
ncbi:Gfo/Idh/MocA family oxidoreductase [Streptomyces sp. NPDC046915]|uniref:Gfo/Idh/MocA family protein n=1 Tax=Streptomyces sp. NPDC046915 TaxID=3155257 RepID=UPI0033F4BE5A